ncbi:MAG TPA: glycosyltransferase family 2 protein [Candidatus Binataceae bacterium]|nr:glycosyltransferase family 2 protein [Candidatus Binataceae bacterium]
MSPAPDVSVVIVSFNTRDLLRECIGTLYRQADGVSLETIVVDNASRDSSAEMIDAEFPEIKLIRSDINLGFAAANNRGFAVARGRYVVLLNSDAFPETDALRRSVEKMDRAPRVGLAGARLIGRDGSWQPSARTFPSVLNDFLALSGLAAKYAHSRFFGRFDRTWADQQQPAQVDWVPGAYSIIRRDLLEQIGYFDERFFLYYEEVDLCRRVKAAGYQVWYWPDVVVVHLGGESSKTVTRLSMSSSGRQLTLWRMRAGYLYYRKHHGFAGAFCAMNAEAQWYRLRALLARRRRDPNSLAKAEDSQLMVAASQQAWRDTRGGLICPPKPW